MGDRYIHLKEISVDFIKRRPTSDLELIFKDHAGVKHKSNKFKQGDLVRWNVDAYVRTNTSGTLTIRRVLFNIRVAEISVEIIPNEFGDDGVVRLEDSNHRVSFILVCGRSQSLADVARALDSQTRTSISLAPNFFMEHPPLAALPLPSPEQGHGIIYAAIHLLNNDILLDMFNFYRLDEENDWNVRLGWCKLSQVCQRWRCLVHESASHLGMHIECTNGTPIVDTLDHLPTLPLHINYSGIITPVQLKDDESGLFHALRLRDRVQYLYLQLPPPILQKCLVLMDEHFPMLEYLSLSFTLDNITTLTLPKGFLAPNLRHLSLPGICPLRRLQFLTSTVSLVMLMLCDIQLSSYFRPGLLVARLSSLPQLEKLDISFSIPIPRPSTERELLGAQGTPLTLPNLKHLSFRGVSAYLESFIAQIRAPILNRLDITLFNQIAFALPLLSHFINITGALKLPTVKVFFGREEVFIVTFNHGSVGTLRLCVVCTQLDWQINCAAQLCTALIPAISDVERFVLDFYDKVLPTEWQDGGVDSTTWHELLSPFTGMKVLHIEDGLSKELSRALQVDGVWSQPGFLPNLQNIFAERNLFASLIDTRRVMGRPIQFMEPTSPAFPKLRQNKGPPPP